MSLRVLLSSVVISWVSGTAEYAESAEACFRAVPLSDLRELGGSMPLPSPQRPRRLRVPSAVRPPIGRVASAVLAPVPDGVRLVRMSPFDPGAGLRRVRPLLVLAPWLAAALGTAAVAAPSVVAAQTLRGSPRAVERAHSVAVRRGLAFRSSRREVERLASRGHYVSLRGGRNYRLKGVTMPYVLPATQAFVQSFAADYRSACGSPLVITSAMRSSERLLPNSTPLSVHPTGMAVDLRAPTGRCRNWLRASLLRYERRGVVDATEERHPAHFHVVVYREP